MKGLGDFSDFIVGRVVADDHFEVRVGLVKAALNGAPDVFRPVVGRNTNRNENTFFLGHR